MKFYKIRGLIFIFLTKILSRLFVVELPPVLSVSAIIEKEGTLLFLDHSYIKGYGLPGGIVKAGEDIEETLKREIKEETGLDVVHSQYFTSTASFHRSIPLISISFMVKVSGSENDSPEGKIMWLHPNEALGKMAYIGMESVLKKYINHRMS